jgi:hypothetical protein
METQKLNVVVKKTNDIAMQAIKKELNLEELLKQEEQEREEREEIEIIKQIEAEKKKSECIMKAIKERQLDNAYNIKAQQEKQQIEVIKKQAAQQVISRRNNLKAEIAAMRKRASQRRNKLAQQLNGVRLGMAKTLGNAYKNGDYNRCSKALQNENERENYCIASYPDDLYNLTDCRSIDNFCTMCCDNEYGDMLQDKRTMCYDKVCPKGNVRKAAAKKDGKWVWQVPSAV